MQHARGEFIPLLYSSRIYLPGGPTHPFIEVFDPAAHSFSTLTFDNGPSQVAWIAGHYLVLVSKRAVKKLDLRWPFLPPAALTYSTYRLPATACSPTAAVHGSLYFVGNDGCAHQLQLARDELVDFDDFSRTVAGCPKIWDISHMTMHQYDPVCRSWQRHKVLSRSIAWDAGSRFTKIDEDTLAVCGNCKPGIKQALLVRAGGGSRALVEDLPGLLQDRSCPGLIAYNGVLYAFGGRFYIGKSQSGECMNSGESLALQSAGTWSNLPLMSEGRYCFTPAAHEERIYLAGGYAGSIEVYSTHTAAFTGSIQLPESSSALSLVEKSKLLVLTEHWKVELDLTQEDANPLQAKEEHFNLTSRSQPVSYELAWYFCVDMYAVMRIEFHPAPLATN